MTFLLEVVLSFDQLVLECDVTGICQLVPKTNSNFKMRLFGSAGFTSKSELGSLSM